MRRAAGLRARLTFCAEASAGAARSCGRCYRTLPGLRRRRQHEHCRNEGCGDNNDTDLSEHIRDCPLRRFGRSRNTVYRITSASLTDQPAIDGRQKPTPIIVPTRAPPELDAAPAGAAAVSALSRRLVSRRGSSRLAALVGAGFAAIQVVPCAALARRTNGRTGQRRLLAQIRYQVLGDLRVARRTLLHRQIANEACAGCVVHLAVRRTRIAVDACELDSAPT